VSRIRSLKGLFPFSFGVTSYLYPADILPNLRRLRGVADEMELVLFEGKGYSNLPSRGDVGRFSRIAGRTGMRFNVHLPLDIDVASMDDRVRTESMDTVSRIVELTAPLDPLSYTLHVLRDEAAPREAWKARVAESLALIPAPRRMYCVETLSWDLREIGDIIETLDFSVCIDVGHLLLGGYDVPDFFRRFEGRIGMIHLHGVRDGRDHVSLAHLSAEVKGMISRTVAEARYSRSLCLEVFALDDYISSQESLMSMFAPGAGGARC
jgi:sugar phosphate isomerase/epimerase